MAHLWVVHVGSSRVEVKGNNMKIAAYRAINAVRGDRKGRKGEIWNLRMWRKD